MMTFTFIIYKDIKNNLLLQVGKLFQKRKFSQSMLFKVCFARNFFWINNYHFTNLEKILWKKKYEKKAKYNFNQSYFDKKNVCT